MATSGASTDDAAVVNTTDCRSEPSPEPLLALDDAAEALEAVTILQVVEMAIMNAFRVRWQALRQASRGRRRESGARQAAFYVAGRLGRLDFMALSRLSGRERTTVRHAIRRIEQERRERRLDLQLLLLEQATLRGVDAIFHLAQRWGRSPR